MISQSSYVENRNALDNKIHFMLWFEVSAKIRVRDQQALDVCKKLIAKLLSTKIAKLRTVTVQLLVCTYTP